MKMQLSWSYFAACRLPVDPRYQQGRGQTVLAAVARLIKISLSLFYFDHYSPSECSVVVMLVFKCTPILHPNCSMHYPITLFSCLGCSRWNDLTCPVSKPKVKLRFLYVKVPLVSFGLVSSFLALPLIYWYYSLFYFKLCCFSWM